MRRRSVAAASLVGDSTGGIGNGNDKQQGAVSVEASRVVRNRAAAGINTGSNGPTGSNSTTRYSSSAGRGSATAAVEAAVPAMQLISSRTRGRRRKIAHDSPSTPCDQHITPVTPVPRSSGGGWRGGRLVQSKRKTGSDGTTTGASTPTQTGDGSAALASATTAAAAAAAEKMVPGVLPGRLSSTGTRAAAATHRTEGLLFRQPASKLDVGHGRRKTLGAGGSSSTAVASVNRVSTRRSSSAQGATITRPVEATPGRSTGRGMTRTATTLAPSPTATTANSSTTTLRRSGRACQYQPCNFVSTSFGFPGGKGTSCGKHGQDGKVSGTEGAGGPGSITPRRKRKTHDGGAGGKGTGGADGMVIASPRAPARMVPRRRRETGGGGRTKMAMVTRGRGKDQKARTSVSSSAAAVVTFTANAQGKPGRVARSAMASRKPSLCSSGKTGQINASSSNSNGNCSSGRRPVCGEERCLVPARFGRITTRKRVFCGTHKRFGMVNLDKTVAPRACEKGNGRGAKGVVGHPTEDQPLRGGVVKEESENTQNKSVKPNKTSSRLAKSGRASKLTKQPAVAVKVKRKTRSKEEVAADRDGVDNSGSGGSKGSSRWNGGGGGSGAGGAALIKKSAAVLAVRRPRRSKVEMAATVTAVLTRMGKGRASSKGRATVITEAGRPKYQACKSPACTLHASFGFQDGLSRDCCRSHALPGMINDTAVMRKTKKTVKPGGAPASGAAVSAERRRRRGGMGGQSLSAKLSRKEESPAACASSAPAAAIAPEKKRRRTSKMLPSSPSSSSCSGKVGSGSSDSGSGNSVVLPSGMIRSPVYRSGSSAAATAAGGESGGRESLGATLKVDDLLSTGNGEGEGKGKMKGKGKGKGKEGAATTAATSSHPAGGMPAAASVETVVRKKGARKSPDGGRTATRTRAGAAAGGGCRSASPAKVRRKGRGRGCQAPGCYRTASFGFLETSHTFCFNHKQGGMICYAMV